MRIWSLVKIIAGLVVIGVMAFTGMLAYHVTVQPLDGIFAKIIPNPRGLAGGEATVDVSKMLDAAEMPDIDPGEKAYQKAHELLAMGKLDEAREKLTTIVNIYPTSSSAPIARRIVGEMNLDEVLSTSHMEGKQVHIVKRGDSFFSIAAKYHTTIDCMMHLNSMLELRGIQPGDELVVMPLDFRLLVEPQRKALSLWDGGKFVREYTALSMDGVPTKSQRTTVSSKIAEFGGKRLQPQHKYYAAATKVLQIKNPNIQIRGWNGTGEKPASGILLLPQDMEEIALLVRPGNEVEIR